MKSIDLELFNSKALSKASSIRVVGGDDTSTIPLATDDLLLGVPRPKTTPISSTATHIKNDPGAVGESATLIIKEP
jgi:hypothetical protein